MTTLQSAVPLPRPFQHFLAGLTLSRFGDALYVFTLPWLAYSISQSAAVMGLLYATEILPVLLLGAFTGALLDQLDRRKVMLFSDLARLALVVSLPVAQWFGHLTLPHLFLVAFLLSLLTLAFEGAAQTLTPEISGGHLTRANALQQTASQFTLMLGPVLAGMLVATLGPSFTLTVNALSFLGTFFTVLPLKVSPFTAQPITWQSTVKGIQEGFHFMRSHPIIRTLSLQAPSGTSGSAWSAPL